MKREEAIKVAKPTGKRVNCELINDNFQILFPDQLTLHFDVEVTE